MKINKSKVTYTVDTSGCVDTIADADKYVIMTFTERSKELSKVCMPFDDWTTFMVRYGRNRTAYDLYKMIMSCAVKMN